MTAGYHISKRGRYVCDFCDHHKSYKTYAGINTHLDLQHKTQKLEAEVSRLQDALSRAEHKPPKIVEKERIVYRDPPAKPEPKKEYWYTNLFCTTCKLAFRSGIPRGQTIEDTPHSECGTRGLLPMIRVEL